MKILHELRLILFSMVFMIFFCISACSDNNSSKDLAQEPIAESISTNELDNDQISLNIKPTLENNFYYQEGIASWYGTEFHGKITASGELCNMNDMTAAHSTIAFGSLVEVTDVCTGSSIIVRINDRGPSIDERIINLSQLAAEKIDLIKKGLTKVRIKIVR